MYNKGKKMWGEVIPNLGGLKPKEYSLKLRFSRRRLWEENKSYRKGNAERLIP